VAPLGISLDEQPQNIPYDLVADLLDMPFVITFTYCQ
jgi:hypothetical protein